MPPDNQPADTPVGFVGSDPSKFDHCVPATWLFNGSYANIQSPRNRHTRQTRRYRAGGIVHHDLFGDADVGGRRRAAAIERIRLESCWVLSKQYPEVDPFPCPTRTWRTRRRCQYCRHSLLRSRWTQSLRTRQFRNRGSRRAHRWWCLMTRNQERRPGAGGRGCGAARGVTAASWKDMPSAPVLVVSYW